MDTFATENEVTDKEHDPIGTALKYALLAAVEIDAFPHLEGSSVWHSAAKQAALEAPGGYVLDWRTLKPLVCGKRRRRNPMMLALRAS